MQKESLIFSKMNNAMHQKRESVPHPNLKHKDAVELDYQMTEGVLKIKIRAAVAGYLMRLWNVDCSKDHSQEGNEYHLAIYPPLKTSPIRAENHSKYLEFKRAWI